MSSMGLCRFWRYREIFGASHPGIAPFIYVQSAPDTQVVAHTKKPTQRSTAARRTVSI
jgi:hypothetical protein